MKVLKSMVLANNFDEAVEGNLLKLRECFLVTYPEEDYDDFFLDISDMTLSEEINDEWLDDLWAKYLFEIGEKSVLALLGLSIVCSVFAREARNKNNSDLGWLAHSRACYLLGLAETAALGNKAVEKIKNKASRGGNIRAKKLKQARDEVARLLFSEKPDEGWLDETHAITAISERIIKFNREKSIGYTPSRIGTNIAKWMLEEEEVRAAFEATRKKV